MKLSNYRKQDLQKIILATAAVAAVVIAVIVTGFQLGGKMLKPKIETAIAEAEKKKEDQESEKETEQGIENKESGNQEKDKKKITETVSGEEDFHEGETISNPPADETGGDYILPESDVRYLARIDLENLSPEELRIARNEIYARHGRIFEDEGLRDYFSSKNWYVGTLTPEEFQDHVFNDYEKQNLILITDYEKEIND